jgi:hypothetical protein
VSLGIIALVIALGVVVLVVVEDAGPRSPGEAHAARVAGG